MQAFNVIIVGGRVAGSTLASRLGRAGLRVLLLERNKHPSRPAASSPIIYAPAMSLLDEIGADENAYAHRTPQIEQWVIEADGYFCVKQPIPMVKDRNYAYAVDRARFDEALWSLAADYVDVRQGYSVVDLLWEGNKVCGVQAKNLQTGEIHEFHADLVVGADGRFSMVARKVNAQVYDEHDEQPTSVYYAYWKNVQRIHETAAAHMLSTGGDYGLLFMESANDTTVIVIEGRSDVVNPSNKGAEAFYMEFLQSHPTIKERLLHAERVTPVQGMKRISNGYRTAGGAGWALVGDAVHYKDPLDGQGIYDALFTAKALAHAIVKWQCEGASWQDALRQYEHDLRAETQPMYHATLSRVNREIYTRRPAWFMRTLARWLYEDETYRAHWARLFVRQADPQTWFSWRVALLPVLCGLWRDIQRILTNSTQKNEISRYNDKQKTGH